MSITDDSVNTAVNLAVSRITDPGSGAKLVELGLVRDLRVTDGVVTLTFRPSSSVCPVAFTLAPRLKEILEQVVGVTGVTIRVENFQRAAELEALLRDEP